MQTNLGWVFGPEMSVLTAELKEGTWQVSARGRGERACPGCGTRATARHSWQHRRLQDLPVQGARVTLSVRLGRWRCRNPDCARRTFTERLGAIVAPLARRTRRVAELVQLLGYTAGGRSGERLMARVVGQELALYREGQEPSTGPICNLSSNGGGVAVPP